MSGAMKILSEHLDLGGPITMPVEYRRIAAGWQVRVAGQAWGESTHRDVQTARRAIAQVFSVEC